MEDQIQTLDARPDTVHIAQLFPYLDVLYFVLFFFKPSNTWFNFKKIYLKKKDEGSVTHRPSAKNKKWQRLIARIRRQVLAFIFFREQTTSSLSL